MASGSRGCRAILRFQSVVVSMVLLLGCATNNAADDADYAAAEQKYRSTVPTCNSPKECEAKWIAARRWVLDNADMKLQQNSDDFIETYNGDGYTPKLSARVTKTPISETGYRIELELGGNFNRWQVVILSQRFNDAVNLAWAPAPQ